MAKTPNNLTYNITVNGVPLEAHKVMEGVTPATKWITEDFIINHPSERRASIDRIQLFYDENFDEWRHWPTHFSTEHKLIGSELAKIRNESPELHQYKVRVSLHKYVDLSDPPQIRYLPSEGKNPADAVLRLREKIEEEQRNNDGIARLDLKSGSKRYLGSVHMGAVRQD